MVISVSLTIILLIIALMHFLWALRIWFPVNDEGKLARTVAGFKGIERMPSVTACLIVGLFLVFIASLPMQITGMVKAVPVPMWLIASLCFGCGFLFLFRGIAGYLPVFVNLTPEQPFRTYDKLFYSPLCIFIGGGFLYLVWDYMNMS